MWARRFSRASIHQTAEGKQRQDNRGQRNDGAPGRLGSRLVAMIPTNGRHIFLTALLLPRGQTTVSAQLVKAAGKVAGFGRDGTP
jgi:hypothetical protein